MKGYFYDEGESESFLVMSDSATLLSIQSLEFSRPEGEDPLPRGSSQARDQTQSPTLQVDSLPAEPQGKPKNTGVASLPRLQWIFLTQELNRGLLHCRWILYQLSHQGSPLLC